MINGQTSLVGLLGNPVNHSLSPVIQNVALKAMGLNWCYLAMPCESQDLKMVTKTLRKLNCKGLNITIPHKERIIEFCDSITPLAKRVGAINTLIPNEKQGWNGANTDIEGFLTPLQSQNWEGQKAIVLGCGGSARAVITGLETLHFNEIIIIGRKESSLKRVISDQSNHPINDSIYSNKLIGLIDNDRSIIEHIKTANLIVNTTPVGMASNNQSTLKNSEIPLGKDIWKHLVANTTLYDLIYTPRPTPWLILGAKMKCKQIDGLEMLVQQGAASLKLWSNYKQIPIDLMRKAAKKHLTY